MEPAEIVLFLPLDHGGIGVERCEAFGAAAGQGAQQLFFGGVRQRAEHEAAEAGADPLTGPLQIRALFPDQPPAPRSLPSRDRRWPRG